MRKTTTEKVFFCRQVYKWNAKWLRSTFNESKENETNAHFENSFQSYFFPMTLQNKTSRFNRFNDHCQYKIFHFLFENSLMTNDSGAVLKL